MRRLYARAESGFPAVGTTSVRSYPECMSTDISPNRIVTALDCPDPVELAEFYAALLGWEVLRPGPEEPDFEVPEWVSVRPPDFEARGISFGFQRVDDYRAPVWPDGPIPQQAHLDFWVDSIPEAEKIAVALGATRHEVQPGEADGEGFVVFLDPAGHPFCLCRA